ncbi:hypothetical protein M947_01700 [Sulfurimonas hongkongensis]|uniref:Retropepsin-like aspartic endopeptidase domain-containing protein n=1 Tax=Sulfurimonas hongkongensis TaxID=1172190 RepID=T0JQU4_9BACT|nr:RimK/LysX family protein [Sulfurimonas hongkongensis]EQB40541.1 hypothetical protein M947_01700 [Sulfurimonas hongkongensis]
MVVKNLLYFFLIFFLSGCTQAYTTTNTQHLDALNKQITNLEQNLSQKLDTKLEKHDENYKRLLETSLLQQAKSFESLKSDLITLLKPAKPVKTKVVKTKQKPIIVENKILSLKEKLVIGSVERVHVYPSNFVMEARIDTGAETSSIDAREITRFERDGKKWVRFTLVDRETGTSHVVERKVVRVVRISQSSLEKDYEKRVIVVLKITIGDKKELSEFTLTNREHMKYPMLIGRSALQDVMVVDVSEEYLAPLVIRKKTK